MSQFGQMAPVTNFTIEVKVNFILSFSHFLFYCVCVRRVLNREKLQFSIYIFSATKQRIIQTNSQPKKKRTIPNTEKLLPNNKDTMTFDQKQQNEKSTQYNRIGLDEPKKIKNKNQS